MLEEGHLSRTVEDHCSQLHLSVDERFDDAWVVRSDSKARRRQAEVED
jgi:ribosome-interacting GTPase 1